MLKFVHFFLLLAIFACKSSSEAQSQSKPATVERVIQPGAYMTAEYFHLLDKKNVALVINQTSTIGNSSLADTLLSAGIKVRKIFAPEHGFRGKADAGAHISNETDLQTGIPVVSLYGSKKKPTPDDLSGIDVLVFDIQDVGVRFYTYISTLHYVMEACAEQNIKLIVLDRPNPLGFYIDGPVLDKKFTSFVGMHSVPVIYGMTIGEYAAMIKGENWIKKSEDLDLLVVRCKDYDHTSHYDIPVAPSPNLRTTRSILLYPSLCFFEGTIVSVGRGTDYPFEVFGYPGGNGDFSFTPRPSEGASDPLYNGKRCVGYSLHNISFDKLYHTKQINLQHLIKMYNSYKGKDFFLANHFFDKLAGTDQLKEQILSGMQESKIRESWQPEIEKFRKIRKKYLLYKDFE